ncbi:MAG: ZIP family metal transporter [Pseudomonadota bacterium]
MQQPELLALFAIILTLTAVAGGYLPMTRGHSFRAHPMAERGEAGAVGVFLGAGLIHMLSDAVDGFSAAGVDAMWPHTIAGATVLALVAVEHAAQRLRRSVDDLGHPSIALLAAAMLSIHTFLAGAALGTRQEISVAVVVFIALLGHKFAAAFALGVTLGRSALALTARWAAFALFVVMLPVGILSGALAAGTKGVSPLLAPFLTALAAGTFIHLALLHDLQDGMMVKRCRDRGNFAIAVAGFLLMALIALWV